LDNGYIKPDDNKSAKIRFDDFVQSLVLFAAQRGLDYNVEREVFSDLTWLEFVGMLDVVGKDKIYEYSR
jgi:hypothetical protein